MLASRGPLLVGPCSLRSNVFLTRHPPPALRDAVTLLWAVERDATHWERVLPSPRPQLLIRRASDRLHWHDAAGLHHAPGAALGGPFPSAISIDAAEQDGVLGIVFAPGGLRAFVEGPICALAGTYLPLSGTWPALIPALEPCRSLPLGAALEHLEATLIRQRSHPTDPGVRRAMHALASPGARVQQVADALGWSRRTLSRRFTATVGLSPKRFARVQRFRGAIAALEPHSDLARHARAWGYADQAHFNHDFRALSGMTPGQWRAAERPYATHARVCPISPRNPAAHGSDPPQTGDHPCTPPSPRASSSPT